MIGSRILCLCLLFGLGRTHSAFGQQEADQPNRADSTPAATAHALRVEAVRAAAPVRVDGILEDAVWRDAVPITVFVQNDPDEGRPASERTEVRIVFDHDAIYVAARMFDSQRVTTRLARRDAQLADSDLFAITLDSYHDHQTGYRFVINPSGVRRDEVISGTAPPDANWDPIWEAATQISDSGWTAELRIPFSQLRFSRAASQTWGIQLERRIARRQEHAVLAFTPKRERSGPSRFAHLEAIAAPTTGKRVELLPYVVARGDYRDANAGTAVNFSNPFRTAAQYDGQTGLDAKWRVTSNLTLDATINPDFGQVELDPAVINLTAFETRYDEKRPFFVEGVDIFRIAGMSSFRGPGGNQLLYSRRIGRAPQGVLPSDAVYADVPDAATIVGAAKLTGKSPTGWGIGVLQAVTAREFARYVDAAGEDSELEVEPLTNYFVARVNRSLRTGQSLLGGIITTVHRDIDSERLSQRLRSAAYTGAMDFRHEWASRSWSAVGTISLNRVVGSASAITATQRSSARYYQRPDADHLSVDSAATSLHGHYARFDVGRRAGAWQGSVAVTATSPGYEINDLGFQSSADRVNVDTNLRYEQTRPGRWLRRWSVMTGPDFGSNYAGDVLRRSAGIRAEGTLLNYWGGSLHMNRELPSYNDRLTRGGPLTRDPANSSLGLNVNTDPRKRYALRGGFNRSADAAGGGRLSGDVDLTIRPAAGWDIRVGPSVSRSMSAAQYVTSIRDTFAVATFGRRYIFAGLEQTTFALDTRLNLTFTPALTLELYAQPFISSGDYRDLKELRQPRTFSFRTFGEERSSVTRSPSGVYKLDPDGSGPAAAFNLNDRDFTLRSLRGNAVLRWEWRTGSALYLVWQQNRANALNAFGDDASAHAGRFHLADDFTDLLALKPENVFLLKVNYWLNI